jgi:hypothetical protein
MLLRGEIAAKIANKWNGTVPSHETEILRDVNWSAALLTHR